MMTINCECVPAATDDEVNGYAWSCNSNVIKAAAKRPMQSERRRKTGLGTLAFPLVSSRLVTVGLVVAGHRLETREGDVVKKCWWH